MMLKLRITSETFAIIDVLYPRSSTYVKYHANLLYEVYEDLHELSVFRLTHKELRDKGWRDSVKALLVAWLDKAACESREVEVDYPGINC